MAAARTALRRPNDPHGARPPRSNTHKGTHTVTATDRRGYAMLTGGAAWRLLQATAVVAVMWLAVVWALA